jgi:hypothetical protein
LLPRNHEPLGPQRDHGGPSFAFQHAKRLTELAMIESLLAANLHRSPLIRSLASMRALCERQPHGRRSKADAGNPLELLQALLS